MSYFPLTTPTYKKKIKLPNEDVKYYEKYSYDHYIYSEDKVVFGDIDMERVSEKGNKNNNFYSLDELKEIASKLDIVGFKTMNKKDLVKFIKFKVVE